LSAIVAANANGTTLLAASPGGGVWRSLDGGSTWTFPAQYGLGDNSAVHLEWDAATPGRLFLLTWNGLYATTNNGDSWTNLVNPGGFPAPLEVYQTAIADPKPFAQMVFSATQRAVFAAIPCSGLFYSFDGVMFTQTWPFPGGSANLDNCIGTIAADPYSGRVYFSTMNQDPTSVAHVFRSNCVSPAVVWGPGTPCLTWQAANSGLPSYAILSALTSVATSGSADPAKSKLGTADARLHRSRAGAFPRQRPGFLQQRFWGALGHLHSAQRTSGREGDLSDSRRKGVD
jgi:hypothetical protein